METISKEHKNIWFLQKELIVFIALQVVFCCVLQIVFFYAVSWISFAKHFYSMDFLNWYKLIRTIFLFDF